MSGRPKPVVDISNKFAKRKVNTYGYKSNLNSTSMLSKSYRSPGLYKGSNLYKPTSMRQTIKHSNYPIKTFTKPDKITIVSTDNLISHSHKQK